MCSSHITGGVIAAAARSVQHRWQSVARASYGKTPEPGRLDMLLMHGLTEEQISQLRWHCIHRHRLNRNTNRIQFSWSSGAPRRPSGPTQISLTEHTTQTATHKRKDNECSRVKRLVLPVSSGSTNRRRRRKLVPL